MRLIDADELRKNVLKWMPSDPCGKEEKEFPFETDICASMVMEIDDAPTVQPEINCSEIPNSSDVISRQAAIDSLHMHLMYRMGTDSNKKRLDEWINSLPSAQPEQRWIPCSERMPEEHEWIGTKEFGTTISDEVYVTFENLEGERFVKHLSFQNGKLSSFDQSKIDAFCKGSVPIAWMPLPKPYNAGTK